MQIVIDIPEKQYEYLAKIAGAGEEPLGYFERVIMRGTPLPKGHGRLIDIDEVKKKYPLEIDGLDLRSNNQCLHTAMDEAQPIIEAESEKKTW